MNEIFSFVCYCFADVILAEEKKKRFVIDDEENNPLSGRGEYLFCVSFGICLALILLINCLIDVWRSTVCMSVEAMAMCMNGNMESVKTQLEASIIVIIIKQQSIVRHTNIPNNIIQVQSLCRLHCGIARNSGSGDGGLWTP